MRMAMTVLICGGRDFDDYNYLCDVMNNFINDHGQISKVIHGAAAGADMLASRWAHYRMISTTGFPADWKRHGRAAGPIRNQRMLDEGRPDHVIAFPGGYGTADMVRRARNDGIPVTEVRPDA